MIKSKKSVGEEKQQKTTIPKKELIDLVIKKKPKEKFLSENQRKYYNTLLNNEITICSGSSGVGKTHVTLKAAIDLIYDPNTKYEKILIVRPAVEADENIGSLPGTLSEKISPYIFPSVYLLNKLLSEEVVNKLFEEKVIEAYPLGYMRGLNVDNTILIGEEFQNATPLQVKLILTRIGFNSKLFLSGDIEQSDKFKDKTKSGLYDAMNRLDGINGVSLFTFDNNDIVRNPLITEILKKYD